MQEETTRNGMSGYVALPFMAILQIIFPVIFVRGLLTATILPIAIGAIGTIIPARFIRDGRGRRPKAIASCSI